ncbi:hypothetical protein WMY93_005064 [Mugilogobius chulae]|uniref:Beta-microseminoprotein n=1 Tax=Mugilogobius chulae TaxID=88201 RepID=A0AAW0Q1F3_9GOBI
MKYITLTVLLCAVVSLSHGFCMSKPDVKPGATHCVDHVDNTWHAVGSTWINSDCLECDCSSCCSTFEIPRVFPEDCVSVFDKKSCKYIVHKRNDPNTLCQVYGSVGK